jgi:hypothetical protein
MRLAIKGRAAVRIVAGLAAAWLLALPAFAAEKAAESTRPPIVDPRADALLRAMSDFLAEAKQLSYRAEIEFDHVLPTGQKIELGATQDVAVSRPNRVFVEYVGDAGSNRLWYDGRQITVLDGDEGLYAVAPMPGKIDQALDRLMERYGFTAPLSDFLYSNPYEVLRKRVQFGTYVGESQIDGVRCHHLAFVDKEIDWQIWIQDGTQLVPCKIAITYTLLPGQPQFEAVFSGWELDTRLADALFAPMLPPGAARIEFAEAARKVEEK